MYIVPKQLSDELTKRAEAAESEVARLRAELGKRDAVLRQILEHEWIVSMDWGSAVAREARLKAVEEAEEMLRLPDPPKEKP